MSHVRLTLILSLIVASFLSAANARCSVAAPAGHSHTRSADLLLKGTVLTPQGSLENGCVLVRSGKVAYVGTGCGSDDASVTVLDCTGSVISPGFINTHEHIEYSTVAPFEDTGERVDHRHDWRRGTRDNTERPVQVNGTKLDATAWGELRHLFSGTTSIVGGNLVPGLTRNLDFVAGLEDGIDPPVAAWDIFPLDDAEGILRSRDCDYGPNATTSEEAGKLYRYMAHVGEGVDDEAANEFRCLSDPTYDTTPSSSLRGSGGGGGGGGGGLSVDIVASNLALVHALGLTRADFDLVARRGAKVVWSPRSNVFLYGKTLDVTYLLDAGITVALGTDWLPSGSASMTREAVCGYLVTQESFGRTVAPRTLWEMMTVNAAKVAGFEDHVGSLEAGKLADIVVFGGRGAGADGYEHEHEHEHDDAYARVVFSAAEDLELVMRGGKILLAAEGLEAMAGGGACEPVSFGTVAKTVCVEDELGRSFAEFERSLGGVYPAILPAVPDREPTCKATR
ncbi:metal dependent amidohydrolase [Sodiomyces alkalinus F11]|uniref:Metal dependent amidohydrolase n=1 Tax=Sodiomyces alkalinus (strain CBS 110278 / VKM F-3762 / F11) TaxID=1314773 RepID=A0A3N2Q0Y7_SODAK|nr:metal dependent amidohydrolase [Sodiomyces alkalinus F11]ROT40421.1 metal dependent amidohydrolase [Sodiomyces alkalinus F11]